MLDPAQLPARLKALEARYPDSDPAMVAEVVRAVLATMRGDLSANETALLAEVEELARAGFRTGAAGRNWASYGSEVAAGDAAEWQRDLLCDPQTSGGLLIATETSAAESVLNRVRAAGFAQAAVIGRMRTGPATLEVLV